MDGLCITCEGITTANEAEYYQPEVSLSVRGSIDVVVKIFARRQKKWKSINGYVEREMLGAK